MRSLPNIKIENFEGPFDLLIELSRSKKLDLSRISLAKITDEFLEHLDSQSLNHEILADFMLVASTLLLIKAKQLMPDITAEEEEEITDLTDRLHIYNLYREQALEMQNNWYTNSLLSAGVCKKTNSQLNNEPQSWPSFSTEALSSLMRQVIAKIPPPIHPRAHLKTRGRSLQECTKLFYDRLNRVKECVFHDVISGATKQDVAISFLAVLEMSRTQMITLHQESFNDHLLIKKAA